MSTISASTTSTTAFKITTDTTGALVFQTGSSPTTAVTIDTAQNVGIGTSAPGYTASNRIVAAVNGSTSSIFALMSGGTNRGYLYADATDTTLWSEGSRNLNIGTASAGPVVFTTNNTERMRLNSSGNLGVGTPSPAYNLHVTNSGASGTLSLSPASTNGGASYILMGNSDSSGTSGPSIIAAANRNLQFGVGSSFTSAGGGTFTEYMRLDSSGNLGLGVAPSSWGSGKAIEIGGTGLRGSLFQSDSGVTMLSSNYRNNSGDFYVANGYATRYYQYAGQHIWNIAASGTAGNAISFTQAMTLTSGGRLQIGTTTLSSGFLNFGNTTSTTSIAHTWADTVYSTYMGFDSTYYMGTMYNAGGREVRLVANSNDSNGKITFYTGGSGTPSERARIDSGGDWTFPFGWLKSFSAGGTPCLGIGTGDTGFMFIPAGSAPLRIIPRNFAGTGADNTIDLGDAGSRYKTIYAATGTINTSDAREKTAVTPLTADELTAAAQIAASVGTYQWLQAVEEKGAAARHHAGLTVQRAIEIMEANNLDPFAYGFICYDSWQTEEYDGQVLRVAGDRYSFRMDELSLFIARGQQAILETLTSRIAALENK